MFRRFACFAAALTLASLVSLATAPAAHADARAGARAHANADSLAIRATLDSLNAACARRDTTAFMSLWDDADDRLLFVGSSKPEVFHGHAGIRRFRRFLFSMPFVFSFDLANVTIRSDGHFGWAYVDGKMFRTAPDGHASNTDYRYLVVLVKRGHAWKWQAFDGSVPGDE